MRRAPGLFFGLAGWVACDWERRVGALALGAAILALSAACATPTPVPTPTPRPTPVGFANPQLLVETAGLSQRLGEKGLVIVDTRPAADYDKGHIKGAVNIPVADTFLKDSPIPQMAGSKEQIEQLFGAKGIGNDVKVVAYGVGKDTNASRVFWTLEYYGHKNVAVLNGGYTKWVAEKLPTETAAPAITSAKFVAAANPSLLATKEQVLGVAGKGTVQLVDARSPAEYAGTDLRATRGGRIPGAKNLDWTTLFTEGDVPVLKSVSELTTMYQAAGATDKSKETWAYCQTGQRSAVSYFTLRLLGYEKVRNYDGSWVEWGNDPSTPIEK
ncbi:MAG: sulfurtransferase [Chloroflexi bacterium]|nr:sulfurtransferase [Chloroflexota bacterium]